MGNVIMMINNAGDVFQLYHSTNKQPQQLHNLYRSKRKHVQINIRVTFLIIAVLKDSEKFVMQVYEKSYNVCT